MRLFMVTTLTKDVVFATNEAQEVQEFLKNWKNQNKGLLLIQSLSQRDVEDIVSIEGTVSKILISNSIENVSYAGVSLEDHARASQQLEIISSDLTDYETFCWGSDTDTEDLLETARTRRKAFLSRLTRDEDDEDEEE